MKRFFALLTLLAASACNTSVPAASVTNGSQCSSTKTYWEGDSSFMGKAWDEGNGIVSQLSGGSEFANRPSIGVMVVTDCKSGQGVAVGVFSSGDGESKVNKFLAKARNTGQISDLDALLASARTSGFTKSQSFRGSLSTDGPTCACQLAAQGKLPKARH